jgi:hypothetical protein
MTISDSSSNISLTDKFVRFAPPLDGCRQERMPKSEGSRSKCIDHIGIDIRVVSIPVSLKMPAQSNKVNSRYSMATVRRQNMKQAVFCQVISSHLWWQN